MLKTTDGTIDPTSRNWALSLPFVFFAGTLLLALGLAFLNSRSGSVNLMPGESLALPALVLIAVYAFALDALLRRKGGLRRPEHAKPRRILLLVSTFVAAPVLGLLVAPALNGLFVSGAAQEVVVSVEHIETRTVSRSDQLHYYAHIAPGEAIKAGIAPGRYFMGRYDKAWAPDAIRPLPEVDRIRIRFRPGLFGANTLLAALPDD